MLSIDLTGKRALVAGVSDDGGFGFAIAKSLAEAGATICLGSWPPALGIFTKLLERGKMDESMRLSDGRKLEFERVYPLDAEYDSMDDVPAEVRENKRYKEQGDFTIQGMTDRIAQDFGDAALDIVVHSLANAPEVKSPLVDTSRAGLPLRRQRERLQQRLAGAAPGAADAPGGAFLSLTYMAGERVIPGYGGGMSSAKAALEADTRTLAFEAGRRWGVRINAISAGPWASRAASRDRLHRHDDRVHVRQLAAAPAHPGDRRRQHRRLSLQPARRRDHRQRGVRGQRLSRDGDGC